MGTLKGQDVTNPTGPTKGNGRLPEVVIKGGSKDWDGSWRSSMRPDASLPYLGFRCVLNVDGAAPGGNVPGAPAIGPPHLDSARHGPVLKSLAPGYGRSSAHVRADA